MREDLTYKYYRKSGQKNIYLVLHGGGTAGIESPFISEIFGVIADSHRSVLAFNMPCCERADESASAGFKEEVEALGSALACLRSAGYERTTVIAKSLGAIVTSFYLEQTPSPNLEVVVLGYVVGDVKTPAIAPNLKLIIQGEKDRFGDGRAVRAEIGSAAAEVVEIPDADHSYRNPAGQPEYQRAVIQILLEKT